MRQSETNTSVIDAPKRCRDSDDALSIIDNKIMEAVSGEQLIGIRLIGPEAHQMFGKAGLRCAEKRDYLLVFYMLEVNANGFIFKVNMV